MLLDSEIVDEEGVVRDASVQTVTEPMHMHHPHEPSFQLATMVDKQHGLLHLYGCIGS